MKTTAGKDVGLDLGVKFHIKHIKFPNVNHILRNYAHISVLVNLFDLNTAWHRVTMRNWVRLSPKA